MGNNVNNAGVTPSFNLNQGIMDFLSDYGRARKFQIGEYVVKEGEDSSCVFIILDGIANVMKADHLGNDNLIASATKGSIFGEMGVFLDLKRSASIRAKTGLTVLELSNDNFINAIHNFPELSYRMLQNFATKLNETDKKYVELLHEKLMVALGNYILENLAETKAGDEYTYDLVKMGHATKFDPGSVATALINFKNIGVIQDISLKDNAKVSFKVDLSGVKDYVRNL